MKCLARCLSVALGWALLMSASPCFGQETVPPKTGAASGPLTGQITEQKIDEAVTKALEFLLRHQNDDGSFGSKDLQRGNMEEIDGPAMLGLSYAGLSIQNPRFSGGLDCLLGRQYNYTYHCAYRTMVLVRTLGALEGARKMRAKTVLQGDVTWLLEHQGDTGFWSYTDARGSMGDFCNTYSAMRALFEATGHGLNIPEAAIVKTLKLAVQNQQPDGGWNYLAADRSSSTWRQDNNVPSYGSMTAAGAATLCLGRLALSPTLGCPCRDGRSPAAKAGPFDQALDRSLQWLSEHYSSTKNPNSNMHTDYWLYCSAYAGRASGLKYLGDHDWYAEGLRTVMGKTWPDKAGGGLAVAYAVFPLGFMTMGRDGVLVNKLKFEGSWNHRPLAASLLTEHVAGETKQPLRWQIVECKLLEDLQDAPLVYVSSEAPLRLRDPEMRLLRQYTEGGGTILFEASCGNGAMARSVEAMCAELWPEQPLAAIDRTHAMWSAGGEVKGALPRLMGVGDGVRTFVFYAPTDLSCFWYPDAAKKNPQPLQTALNICRYATDLGRVPRRFEPRGVIMDAKYAEAKLKRGEKAEIAVSRIKRGAEWNFGAAHQTWATLSADLKQRIALGIRTAAPVEPGQAVPEGVGLLYLTGRSDCTLDDSGIAWLKKALTGGPLLVAEATCGDKAFDKAFRNLAAKAALTLKPIPPESPVLTGKLFGASGYAIGKVQFSRALAAEQKDLDAPVLLGIYDGERLVGLYSPYDIFFSQTGGRAYDNRGYAASDARALATNIALLVSVK